MQQLPQNAQRQSRVAQRKSDADRGGSRHRHGIGEPVPLPQIVTQSQQDQHNGYWINGVQDGDGNAQDHAQPQIAHEEREKRNDIHPRPIGDFPEKCRKVLRNGVDKSDAGGQAGQREDGRQQHGSRRTEQLVDDAPQGPCAVFLNGIDSGAAHPHVGQHGIHQRQNGSGEDTCQNGVPHPIALFRHAEGTQRGSNDQSEVQGGDGIHGLIALGKALQEGGGVIGRLGRGHVHLSPEQKANEQEHQQHQQTGGQEVADAVHQLSRCHAQP